MNKTSLEASSETIVETIVGIDLGTTNSELAIVRDGRVEVIPVSGASRILPSMVGIGDDGALLVGQAARNQYAVHPERTVRSIKRRMGESARVTMAGKDYAPQEISALILRHLKGLAEAHLGMAVNKAVITVPAFFSDAQRQATREAGEIAGLEVVRIINEPTAAALAYESRHQGARKALVYDLGGGTFDVSVVNLEGDVVEVLASHGDNHLGGDDFDRKLVDFALAGLAVADIDEILLVGGATRTPLVVRGLEQELGKQPRAEVDPDLCVAMGAAVQAALIAGTQTHRVLVDVTPYTFGTSYLGELDGETYPHCYAPLIRKNTPVPVSKSDVFYTVFDGQEKIEVCVYQGEDRDALNNIEIGRFMVEGLSDEPAGNPIVLGLSLDLNGLLEVTAREKKSGLQRSITIGNAIARFEQDQLAGARSRVQALFGDAGQSGGAAPGDDAVDPVAASSIQARRLTVEAQTLVEKAERLLDQVGAQDAEDLVDAIEAVRDALADDEAALKTSMDTLADLLYYLEA